MPASNQKVTKAPAKRRATAAALEKGIAKVRAANAAKAAAKASKAHAVAERARLAKLAASTRKANATKAAKLAAAKPATGMVDALAAFGVPAKAAVAFGSLIEGGNANPTKAGKAPKSVAKAGKASAATTKAPKAAKPAKASAKPATDGAKAPTGAKATIIAMIERKDGASAAEVCKKLGWAKAGATIGRAIKLAPFKVRKERDGDGVLRYYRAEG